MISFIDVVFLIFLSGFIFYGFFFGLIRTLGSLLGAAAGFWAASHFYLQAFAYVRKFFFGYDAAGKIIIFLLLFSIASKLVILGFAIVDRAFGIISIVPFLKTINRLAGAILGLALGILLLSFLVHLFLAYPIIGQWLLRMLKNSKILPYINRLNAVIYPLLPKALLNIY